MSQVIEGFVSRQQSKLAAQKKGFPPMSAKVADILRENMPAPDAGADDLRVRVCVSVAFNTGHLKSYPSVLKHARELSDPAGYVDACTRSLRVYATEESIVAGRAVPKFTSVKELLKRACIFFREPKRKDWAARQVGRFFHDVVEPHDRAWLVKLLEMR